MPCLLVRRLSTYLVSWRLECILLDDCHDIHNSLCHLLPHEVRCNVVKCVSVVVLLSEYIGLEILFLCQDTCTPANLRCSYSTLIEDDRPTRPIKSEPGLWTFTTG